MIKKTDYDVKIKDIQDKMTSITGLATTTDLTAVDNKIPDVSCQEKIDYEAKIKDIEK